MKAAANPQLSRGSAVETSVQQCRADYLVGDDVIANPIIATT